MNKQDLQRLGLNGNEADVYVALAQVGSSDAHQLISLTKFHKNIVYDNLSKLMDKGLVTYILENKVRMYSLVPHALSVWVSEKQKEVELQKKIASDADKYIASLQTSLPEQTQASIFKGKQSIRTLFDLLLRGGKYVVFGTPYDSVSVMGENFWEQHNVKRRKADIRVRMIFNPSLRKYSESIVNDYTHIKFFKNNFDPNSETIVQDNKVVIIVWSNEPVAFLIENTQVASSYIEYFKGMWEQAIE